MQKADSATFQGEEAERMTTFGMISALCLLLAMGPHPTSMQTKDEQRWIDMLRKTPASQLDQTLPSKSLGEWFAEQVKPAVPRYEVSDCGERNGTADEKGKEFPLCVTASADVATARKLELTFAVGTYVASDETGVRAQEKPGRVEFMHGTIGPSDPRSKQPTRLVRKLGDVSALLHS